VLFDISSGQYPTLLNLYFFYVNLEKFIFYIYNIIMCKEEKSSKPFYSTLFHHMIGGFKHVSNQITYEIDSSGHIMRVRVPENVISQIEFITNRHDYNNQLTLKDTRILNENNLEKIEVPGLNEIIQTRIKKIEYIAFRDNTNTFKPFSQSFNGRSFIQMVETLSEISDDNLPTSGKNLIIELPFGNDTPTPTCKDNADGSYTCTLPGNTHKCWSTTNGDCIDPIPMPASGKCENPYANCYDNSCCRVYG